MEGATRHELLVLDGASGSMTALVEALRQRGIKVDIARDLRELRRSFFESGGHDAALLSDDLATAIAARAGRTLLDVDPELVVMAFGEHPRQSLPSGVVRLQAHHPASPAALGAVLRRIEPPKS